MGNLKVLLLYLNHHIYTDKKVFNPHITGETPGFLLHQYTALSEQHYSPLSANDDGVLPGKENCTIKSFTPR